MNLKVGTILILALAENIDQKYVGTYLVNRSATIMTDFTGKEQIFLLDIMIGNLWLFLDRSSLLRNDTFVECTYMTF